MSKTHIAYKIESAGPYQAISLHIPWQNMPIILNRARAIDLDVRKAYIRSHESALFLKETNNRPLSTKKLEILDTILCLTKLDVEPSIIPITLAPHPIDLPKDTRITLYNAPSNSFTTCEFTCDDRVGLLSDILTFFTHLSVDIKSGHVSTVLDQAHNVFHITNTHGDALNGEEMLYISNVFEHEGKHIPIQCITPEY